MNRFTKLIIFIKFSKLSKADNSKFVVTAGNDFKITIWTLPSTKQTPKQNINSGNKKTKGKGKKKPKNSIVLPSNTNAEIKEPVLVKNISHTSKINCLSVKKNNDYISFFIADQTKDISFLRLT